MAGAKKNISKKDYRPYLSTVVWIHYYVWTIKRHIKWKVQKWRTQII